jgi:chromosome segregation ATPase
LRSRLEEVEQRLAEAPPPVVSGAALLNEIPSISDSLRRLDDKLDILTEDLDGLATSGLEYAKPYSVDVLDELQVELDAASEKANGARLSNTAAKTTLELESSELESLQALRRRLLDEQRYDPNDLTLKRKLESLDVAIEAVTTEVELAQAEIETSGLELEVATRQHDLVKAKLALVQESFTFSESELEKQLRELEQSRKDLTEALKEHKSDELVSRE